MGPKPLNYFVDDLLSEALESDNLLNPPSSGGINEDLYSSSHDAVNTSKDTSSSSDKDVTTPSQTSSASSYIPLEFDNAAEFIMFFDPVLREGLKTLYKWQVETLIFLSDRKNHTIENPLDFLLLAANGSGKDAYIIAGFVCFVLCCWKRYKIVITSSSDLQLDTQTRNYIRYLASNVNAYLKENGIMEEAIEIKKESFAAKTVNGISLTASEIITFVTKDGGRAEGHHPFPDAEPNGGVVLVVNEAKTVPNEIYEHFAKCTYNIFIQVSSAGPKSGHFYNSCSNAVEWPVTYQRNRYYLRRVTAYDCPHISKGKLDKELQEYGVDDPWFKNTRLSLFSSVGESVVITEEVLDKCLARNIPQINAGLGRRAGLDLAGGGDENVLAIVDENELVAMESWRAKDTELTVELLCGTKDGSLGLFQKYGLTPEKIFADDNGLGQPIIDGLSRNGWNVRRILNQSSAFNTQRYLNRGAELWFIFARIVAAQYFRCKKELISEKLKRQLTNRHYTQDARLGKLKLLAKSEEALSGTESPDRADALILAFTGTSIFDFTESKEVSTVTTPSPLISTGELLRHSESYHKWQRLGIENQKKVLANLSNPINLIRSLYE